VLKISSKDKFKKNYQVIFYDTTNLKIIKKFTVKVKNNFIKINLPGILSDLVVVINL